MVSKKKKWKLTVVCSLCVMMAGCNNQAGFYVMQQEEGEDTPLAEQTAETNDSQVEADTLKEAEDSESTIIYVQVSGAVQNPGVYELPEGSRIFEAIELAGGLREDADEKLMNQAEPVSDGQLIYVYTIGEAVPEQIAGVAEEQDDRIDLNTATVEQLMTLPGVGQSKAEAIISYRQEQGAFERIEDIMNIEGIKEGVFSKIEEHIKVN